MNGTSHVLLQVKRRAKELQGEARDCYLTMRSIQCVQHHDRQMVIDSMATLLLGLIYEDTMDEAEKSFDA